ncbi:MAG TPA: RNA 2',3'-cyclic phosphodiesterase [Vicinamibacterales bacterium]|jgi:2'-5' RNA ligase
MRLFTGIELDAAVVHAAGELVTELSHRSAELAPRARVAWVTTERMHVTVRFIGHTNDDVAARIRAELHAPVPVPPFTLRVERLGSFPPRGSPRVIWAGLSGDIEGLAAVERDVTARLSRAGIPPEDRPYSPHLTLGRVKEPGGLKTAALVRDLADVVLGATTVEAITLFESRVSSKGPTYIALQRTPLQGH